MKTIIKNIILIAAIGLISFSANAQKNYNVPQSVQDAFAAKYPQAQLKKWKSPNHTYVAYFKNDNKKYAATYSAAGAWVNTERDINRKSGLPEQVQIYLKTSTYASWHIDDMKRVHTPVANTYEINLDNHSGSPFAYEDAGSRENRKLCFDDNGKLLNVISE